MQFALLHVALTALQDGALKICVGYNLCCL